RQFAVTGGRPPPVLIGERAQRLHPLDPRFVDYVEAIGNYVKYHVSRVEYIARDSIKRLDTLLAPFGFVRIAKSLLVNVRAVAYIQPMGPRLFAFTLASRKQLRSGPTYRGTILRTLPLRRRSARQPAD